MILIFSESRYEDLPGLALLSVYLAKRGADNMVLPLDSGVQIVQSNVINMKNVDCIVLSHTGNDKIERLIHTYRSANPRGLVVTMPNDGRPINDTDREWLFSQISVNSYDLFLGWSDYGTPQNGKSKVVGCPRFDVYRDEYKSHFMGNSSATIIGKYTGAISEQKARSVTTVSTEYLYAKFAIGNLQHGLEKIRATVHPSIDPAALIGYDYSGHVQTKYRIGELAIEREVFDGIVLIRPHHQENPSMWNSLLEHGNVKIVRHANIFELLGGVDEHIAKRISTTHMDAWLSGISSGMIDSELAFKLGKCHQDTLDAILSDDTALREKYLIEYGFTQSKPAHQLAGDAILDLIGDTVSKANTFDYTLLDTMLTLFPSADVPDLSVEGLIGNSLQHPSITVINNWIQKINRWYEDGQ